MKLIKNFILLISIFLVMLFNSVVEAADVIPDKINIINQYQLDSRVYFGGNYVRDSSYKATADGKVVYCAEYDKEPPMLNYSFSYTNVGETNAQIAYILMNGYPTRSMTGNKDKDYYITAMSLWYFFKPDADIWPKFDLDEGTYNGTYYDVADWIGKLVRGAEDYSYGESSITLTLSDADNPNVVNTYVSFKGTARMTGVTGNYFVSTTGAPEGTYISDMSGSSKSRFASGESFLVNVPADNIESVYNGIKVNVKAGSDVGKAYLFSVTNDIDYPNYQDVVTLYSDYVEVEDSDTYSMEKPKEPSKVKISKQDVTTGKELPGATITLKDSKGNVIETWVSTTTPHIIEGLDIGRYTLTETVAPDGYILSTESVDFEIKEDGSVTQIIMTNAPTEVKITKVDVANNKELPGAKLTLRYSDGRLVETWVSTTEAHVIKGLKAGKYTLIEEVAPEGYEIMKTAIEFTLGVDGRVSVGETVMKDNGIIIENSPIPVPEPEEPSPEPEPEQVPTGSAIIYIVVVIGALALSTASFYAMKNSKKI